MLLDRRDESAESSTQILLMSDSLDEKHPDTPSAPLQYSATVVLFALFYATIAIISWVASCYLSFKPIGANHYSVVLRNGDNNGYGDVPPGEFQQMYLRSGEWFRAARVLAATAATLTIQLPLLQTMTLANQSWVAPLTWLKLVPAALGGRAKRLTFVSSFLVSAVFLNMLGSIIAPLQQVFLTTATIKTPTFPVLIGGNIDILDQFGPLPEDAGEKTALLRTRLSSSTTTTPQAQLWSLNLTCPSVTLECFIPGQQYTLGNMSELTHPFLTQLPMGFSTGLIRQFALRINSTARRENITLTELPAGCDSHPGAFHVSYASNASLYDSSRFGLEACMPADMSASPWKATRDRQDFSEVLYLAINLTGDTAFSRITVNTTAGFFELPNYSNGGVPGPLIAEDPTVDTCGADCELQTNRAAPVSRRTTTTFQGTGLNVSQSLEQVNKGPLLQIALALFGLGSFIDTRVRELESNSFGLDSTAAQALYHTNLCTGSIPPFLPLLRDEEGENNQATQSTDASTSSSPIPPIQRSGK
ncbi:hypothetical protein FB45DRAFT_1060020 [Roridomyces roridus]|uniref:Uncharacterized protein n=1 Tax=Roridomyces roridus TaxID=1738132 RepID=A0AAD7BQF0_9AGAR|nr:hypothetical protein FB45DRAFT_1060020 [Roridomyces roridus]